MEEVDNPFLKDNRLAKNASLNRLKIVDIPNINIDYEVKGKLGSEIMSHERLIEYIKKDAKRLKLDLDNISESKLPIYLNKSLESNDLEVRLAAENIARRLGRNLGHILLVLKRGDEINQKARKDWNHKHWAYWKEVEKIIFTGGLCNGNLGKRFKYYIEEVFAEADTAKYKIRIAKKPSLVSIIGAARHTPKQCNTALVFDFGQTLIKRSVAKYQEENLKEIYQLSSMESRHVKKWRFENKAEEKIKAEKLKDYIISVIEKTWNEVESQGFKPCSTIAISIADNLVNGKFTGGGYGKLRLIKEDVQQLISKKISDIVGRKIELLFIHDGTAAADAFAGVKDSAMITLGTAIGIGFPLEKNNLRSLAKGIKFRKEKEIIT